MVRTLMDGRYPARPITLFVHHLQSPCTARATVDKIFQLTAGCQVAGSYLQLRAWPPDRTRRPNKAMEFRFFDGSRPDGIKWAFSRDKR